MPGMDQAAFASWLAGIGLLNPEQRGRTYHGLALAEANDPVECRDNTIDAGSSGDLSEAAPHPVNGKDISAAEPAPAKIGDQPLLSKVGRDRIANFGCPHCGRSGVHRWGSASGKPRYRCTSCRKTFNPVTGTPLAGLHRPERWNDQAAALISGESLAPRLRRSKPRGEALRRASLHRVPLAAPFPRRPQSGRAAVFVRTG